MDRQAGRAPSSGSYRLRSKSPLMVIGRNPSLAKISMLGLIDVMIAKKTSKNRGGIWLKVKAFLLPCVVLGTQRSV